MPPLFRIVCPLPPLFQTHAPSITCCWQTPAPQISTDICMPLLLISTRLRLHVNVYRCCWTLSPHTSLKHTVPLQPHRAHNFPPADFPSSGRLSWPWRLLTSCWWLAGWLSACPNPHGFPLHAPQASSLRVLQDCVCTGAGRAREGSDRGRNPILGSTGGAARALQHGGPARQKGRGWGQASCRVKSTEGRVRGGAQCGALPHPPASVCGRRGRRARGPKSRQGQVWVLLWWVSDVSRDRERHTCEYQVACAREMRARTLERGQTGREEGCEGSGAGWRA